jgi:GDPmannose 4,6-dehydratase
MFVTRKIKKAVARIRIGARRNLYPASLDALRDRGVADDFFEAASAMLQHDIRGGYVIGAGEFHSAREFVELALGHAALDWREYVETDLRYYHPTDAADRCADSFTARRQPGSKPYLNFQKLRHMMVDLDREVSRAKIASGLASDGPSVGRFS